MPGADYDFLLSKDLEPIFWTPERLNRPSTWWGHVPFAFWITAISKPRLVVELGTQQGVSYAAFCEAVARSRLETRCYAVDTWGGDAHTGSYDDDVYNDLKDFHDKRYASFSELLRKTFDDACDSFEDGTIDLLHIDGYHTYEAVRHDFETWRPKLSERAVVLFHDTNVREGDFGVWRFFGELKKELPSFEFLHCYGLGVAVIGAEAPGAVRELCGLTQGQDIAAVRERFSHLGARWMASVGAKLENAELEARLRRLEGAVIHKDAQIAELTAHLPRLEESIANKDEFIANKDAQIAEYLYHLDRINASGWWRLGLQLNKLIGAINPLALLNAKSEHRKRIQAALARLGARTLDLLSQIRPWRGRTAIANGAREVAEPALCGSGAIGSDLKGCSTAAKDTAIVDENHRMVAAHFDVDFYLRANPDVREAGVDPLSHYLVDGWREGRDPSAEFNTSYYLHANPDVQGANVCPLLHYVLHGAAEGRLRTLKDTTRALIAKSAIEKSARERAQRSLPPDPQDALPSAKLREELGIEKYRGLIIAGSQNDYVEILGGVQNCVNDEEAAFLSEGWAYLHLCPAQPLSELSEVTAATNFLVSVRLNGKRLGMATASDLAEQLTPTQRSYKPCHFILHHLFGFSPEAIAQMAEVIQPERNIVWIHDFITLCPSYALMRNDIAFCNAPPVESKVCAVCCYGLRRRAHLTRVRNLFKVLQPVVLAPSESALSLWLKRSDFPHSGAKVVPHGRLFLPIEIQKKTRRALRVGFLGAHEYHKGWYQFERLAERFRNDERYEFFHLGTQSSPTAPYIGFHEVKVDRFARDAMIRAVASIELDVVVLWSLCYETFSFTTYEALAGGAFVLARQDAGNVWPAILEAGEERGCSAKTEEEMISLFETGKIIEVATFGEMGQFEPSSGSATFLLQEKSDA